MNGTTGVSAAGQGEDISLVESADCSEASTEVAVPASAGAASRRNQRGMVSAEWAVGIIAAIAIAGVLLGVVTNGAVEEKILGFILDVIAKFSNGLAKLN